MDQPRPAPSCALIVFGAGGDLFKRLLAPAIYNLLTSKLLPERFCSRQCALGVRTWTGDDEIIVFVIVRFSLRTER